MHTKTDTLSSCASTTTAAPLTRLLWSDRANGCWWLRLAASDLTQNENTLPLVAVQGALSPIITSNLYQMHCLLLYYTLREWFQMFDRSYICLLQFFLKKKRKEICFFLVRLRLLWSDCVFCLQLFRQNWCGQTKRLHAHGSGEALNTHSANTHFRVPVDCSFSQPVLSFTTPGPWAGTGPWLTWCRTADWKIHKIHKLT